MKDMKKLFILSILLVSIGCVIDWYSPGFGAQNPPDQSYFYTEQFSVLLFNNDYAVGKQGGIEMILYNNRISTNGNIYARPKVQAGITGNEQTEIFRLQGRKISLIDRPSIIVTRDEANMIFSIDSLKISGDIKMYYTGASFRCRIALHEIPDPSVIDYIGFEMEFYPGSYAGKSYSSLQNCGIFPYDFVSQVNLSNPHGINSNPLACDKNLWLSPEDRELSLKISSNQDIYLYDDRYNHSINWYKIVVPLNPASGEATEITFEPVIDKNWRKPPMIGYSQIGYRNDEMKEAVIELSKSDNEPAEAQVLRLNHDGSLSPVLRKKTRWLGPYLRYNYASFDFSEVKTDGLYVIKYGPSQTGVFPIKNTVYTTGVWQPTLDIFMPVQMCHMRVMDKERIWHGVCHLDDGRQAPPKHVHFDGFRQGDSTDTRFKGGEVIPGMNVGGWHDAGDDDINTGSNGTNVYALALAFEKFGIENDQTTVDFVNRKVLINRPDGTNDAIQQIVHGVNWLLAQFKVADHSFVGTISPDFTIYLQAGDWASFSDNSFDTYPARRDDRMIFTGKDSGRDFYVAAILSASYRALKKSNPEIADECLSVARKIWQTESATQPVSFNSLWPSKIPEQKINAAVELYLATSNPDYLNFMVENYSLVKDNFRETAWSVSRVIDQVKDRKILNAWQLQLKEYATELQKELNQNPFGTVDAIQTWGIGWEILMMLYKHYYLIEKYPELFPVKQMANGVQYMFGVHAGSNLTLVSGVGAHKPIPAFGTNRNHYSYITGGHYSGPARILPDFIELKDTTPFIWQQSEYIIAAAGPYIFVVLAYEHLLDKARL